MLFVKFPSKDALDHATMFLNSLIVGMVGKRSFMNEDQPIQIRSCQKFLREVKKLLTSIEWGFTKKGVKYDVDAMTLSVGGIKILQVSVDKYKLHVKSLDAAWTGWAEFHENAQYCTIQKELQDKLSQAEGRNDKGKGKGA